MCHLSKRRSQNAVFPLIALFVAIACPSCDRQKQLLEEKKNVEFQLQQAHQEHKFYEDKFRALGPNTAVAAVTIERQAQTLERKCADLQAEISADEAKIKALEAVVKKFKPLAEQYRAKTAR